MFSSALSFPWGTIRRMSLTEIKTGIAQLPVAFPHTDLGIVKALGEKNPKHILETADRWRPWQAYAVMHLWKSLEKAPANDA